MIDKRIIGILENAEEAFREPPMWDKGNSAGICRFIMIHPDYQEGDVREVFPMVDHGGWALEFGGMSQLDCWDYDDLRFRRADHLKMLIDDYYLRTRRRCLLCGEDGGCECVE